MNTLPSQQEVYDRRPEGAALAYDGGQVDLRQSDLPSRIALEAIELATSAADFDPADTSIGHDGLSRRQHIAEAALASTVEAPQLATSPQELVGTYGKYILKMREDYDLAA